MKEIIRTVAPDWLLNKIRLFRLKYLIQEINSLNYRKCGLSSDSTPWVELENGLRFHGLATRDNEREIYRLIEPKISGITEDCFGVLLEIISRYVAPRSIPGEIAFSSSKYELNRDPLNDFDLNLKEKQELAQLFRPKEGETIVDIGAFHGFGTMRMAEYVGSSGKIVACEADPVSLKILEKNFKENGFSNITVVPKAVSNYSKLGGKFFYDGLPSGNSLRDDVLIDHGIDDLTEIDVDIDCGDNVLRQLGIEKIDHLSVTINGGEPEALLGLSEIINNSEHMRITAPGWYYRDGERLDAILQRVLCELNFKKIKTGKLGRVIAWK